MFKHRLRKSVLKFEDWLKNFGELSYDRYDYWSSPTGIFAKKLFYKNKYLGFPLAFWGVLLENFFPSVQKIYSKPHREVIGDSHLASAYLNLFKITGNQEYLTKAVHFLDVMKETSTKGYSGYCWGYTFGWETEHGFWNPGIPLITITPYAFWAFTFHFELTGNEESKRIAVSIAEFALKDLRIKIMDNGTKCSSYSPTQEDIVINSNTYRAAVLMEAYNLTQDKRYYDAALDNINFTLSYQGKEGEWYYEAKTPENNFIDNLHTCFVIRNLYKCFIVTHDEKLLEAIKKGYQFYISNLFYPNGRPKHFAKARYVKLRKYEMYDYAEGITLGVLLRNEIPEALDKAIWLSKDLIYNFQTKKGYFVTRVTSLGTKHKIPYLRWPQTQLFYALTNLLKVL
jgi:uncharacterized protein YyaL (SSP411 family)